MTEFVRQSLMAVLFSEEPFAVTFRKKSVWASHWLVALHAFYKHKVFFGVQVLSPLKLPPPACPGTSGTGFIRSAW